MTSRSISSPVVAVPVAAWTGWVEAELFSYPGPGETALSARAAVAIATVEVAVRLDIVTWWIGSRTLAVADRDALRAWVATAFEPLHVDDVVFVLADGQLCLRIDGAGPYALAAEAVQQLVEVL
jgi:hypothetical protein